MMELRVERQPAIEDALPGDLFIDDARAYVTLERASTRIPLGRYRVRLTVSERASYGELWSPDPDHRLPLIDGVAGRSGIRFHALNEASESAGCIGVGQRRMGVTIRQSRSALADLMGRLDGAKARGEAVWLTIDEATGPDPKQA